nr:MULTISPECIES: hypothetical protein [unclassified Streptomyces]
MPRTTDSGGRAEGLDLVGRGGVGVGADQQGVQEGAPLGGGVDHAHLGRVAVDEAPGRGDGPHRPSYVLAQGETGDRAHPHALRGGVADGHPGEPGRDRVERGALVLAGYEDAADGGALPARLDRHLGHDLPYERTEAGTGGRAAGRATDAGVPAAVDEAGSA